MKFRYLNVLALLLAAPLAAQSGAGMASTNKAAKIELKVDSGLARSAAKVSADEAYDIARRSVNGREVSSAELRMSSGKLIYEVKVLNDQKKASIAYVDAQTGELLDAKTYGTVKGRVIHHQENNKLKNAKRDSAARNP